eukprot:scaffold216823_cov36-Prasinocladus_malaysianus.AAC.1
MQKRQGERRAAAVLRPLALATAGRLLGDLDGSGMLFARYLSTRTARVHLVRVDAGSTLWVVAEESDHFKTYR